jgi:hypothetical protein
VQSAGSGSKSANLANLFRCREYEVLRPDWLARQANTTPCQEHGDALVASDRQTRDLKLYDMARQDLLATRQSPEPRIFCCIRTATPRCTDAPDLCHPQNVVWAGEDGDDSRCLVQAQGYHLLLSKGTRRAITAWLFHPSSRSPSEIYGILNSFW